jgi:hypothetical protein
MVPGDALYVCVGVWRGGETMGGRDGRPRGASYAGREMESSSSSIAEDMFREHWLRTCRARSPHRNLDDVEREEPRTRSEELG